MRRIILFCILLCMSHLLNAQTHTLKGSVADKQGNPIVGAGVFIKGTKVGEITDSQGKFKIDKVSEKDILSISFIGYTTQEVTVGKRDNLSVTLVEDQEVEY